MVRYMFVVHFLLGRQMCGSLDGVPVCRFWPMPASVPLHSHRRNGIPTKDLSRRGSKVASCGDIIYGGARGLVAACTGTEVDRARNITTSAGTNCTAVQVSHIWAYHLHYMTAARLCRIS
jgi:hypothetical protein